MISKQYLLTCHQPHHPGYKHVHKPTPPRNMKSTIQIYRDSIQHLLPIINKKDLKTKIKQIHTTEVANTIQNYPPNKVLHNTPPLVNKEEASLPREARSKLTQLRTGYSRMLNSYTHRIDPTIDDKCNHCNGSPHDSNHLFNCQNNPTNLQVLDLWTKPVLAANFLNLDNGIT